MQIASLYIKETTSSYVRGWSNAEIYPSIEELKDNHNVNILVDLDSSSYIAYHPKYAFQNSTNVISVSSKPNTVHSYGGYDSVWIAGKDGQGKYIDFDSLPRD